MSTEMLMYLRLSTKSRPCVRRSHCRVIDCTRGQVCRNERCLEESDQGCALKKFHGIDPTVAGWVNRKCKMVTELPVETQA